MIQATSSGIPQSDKLLVRGAFSLGGMAVRDRLGSPGHAGRGVPDGAARRCALSAGVSSVGTMSSVTDEQLGAWVAALDAVIDELHDDLVRRSIVHLQALRADLQGAASRSD